MLIATWNINGIKARIDTLGAWLKEAGPDILCMQEVKSLDEGFAAGPLEDLGYNVATHGQKGFNGVAILSRAPFDEVIRRLPGDDTDEQARYMEAVVSGKGRAVRVASIYLPNGNPPDSDKYPYKLAWMDRLAARTRQLLALEEAFFLAGDYNAIPEPRDARRPEAWVGDALFLPATRARFHALVHLGLTDAVRQSLGGDGVYTFWDYQAGAWANNNGIRIDHILMSPQAADLFRSARIDAHVRGWEKPSDHVPVVVEIDG
jgi:exodeoxyribonuclease III